MKTKRMIEIWRKNVADKRGTPPSLSLVRKIHIEKECFGDFARAGYFLLSKMLRQRIRRRTNSNGILRVMTNPKVSMEFLDILANRFYRELIYGETHIRYILEEVFRELGYKVEVGYEAEVKVEKPAPPAKGE